jgi:hypothetical protein
VSITGGIESFDSELLRAFINSQGKTADGDPLAAARRLIENTIKENVTQTGSDKVNSELLSLLNKLELNSEIISQLKENFTEIKNSQDAQLSKLNIPAEEDFEVPEKLIKALRDYNPEETLKAVRNVKEIINGDPEISPKTREAVEEIEKNIKQVLKELKPYLDLQEDGPQPLSTFFTEKVPNIVLKPETTEKLLSFERALDKLSLSQEFLKLEKPGDKLLLLLHTVAEKKDSDPEVKAKLEEVVRQQIELLKNIEDPIKKLLISPSSEGQLTTLIRVLENINIDEIPADNPLQQKYNDFINQLTMTLKNMLGDSVPEKNVKDYLFKVLDTIYKEFKLEPLETRIFKGLDFSDIKEFLRPEQIVSLKLIEAQINLILNSPKESLFEQKKGDNPGEVILAIKSKELQVLLELLERPEAKEAADKVKPLIIEILKNGTLPEAADKEVRKVLKEVNETVIKETIEKNANNPVQKLDEKQGAQLKLLSDLIKEVIQNEIKLGSELTDSAILEKISASPVFKNLVQLLKKIDQSLPGPYNALENDFVEFAGTLLEKIEHNKASSVSKLSENLSKALDKLDTKFLSQISIEKETVLGPLNLSALKNLENIASGQEMFQRLNPILQRAGEPMVLLFPFVMQGMLSRLEVNFSAKNIEKHDKKKKKKGTAQRAQFETIKFNLSLPNLGALSVNILHNQEEILALLNFENKVMAEKIEPALELLEVRMRAIGFQKIQISTSAAKLNTSRPLWLSAILNAK